MTYRYQYQQLVQFKFSESKLPSKWFMNKPEMTLRRMRSGTYQCHKNTHQGKNDRYFGSSKLLTENLWGKHVRGMALHISSEPTSTCYKWRVSWGRYQKVFWGFRNRVLLLHENICVQWCNDLDSCQCISSRISHATRCFLPHMEQASYPIDDFGSRWQTA